MSEILQTLFFPDTVYKEIILRCRLQVADLDIQNRLPKFIKMFLKNKQINMISHHHLIG